MACNRPPLCKMKVFTLLLLFITLTTSAFGKEYRVGVLYWSMNIEGQVAMRKGLEETANNINRELKPKGDRLTLIPYVAGDGRLELPTRLNKWMR